MLRLVLWVGCLTLSATTFADHHFSYEEIAKRFPKQAMSASERKDAEMQGECLVGLKQLIFRERREFDPVAEWSNLRSISLLEQFKPCEVLVMIEVAQRELREEQDT